MDSDETTKTDGGELEPPLPQSLTPPVRPSPFAADIETAKRFFHLTGGSIFYCISAVLTTYGLVNVLGPVLAGEAGLVEALPCILTLHVYELALLGVLILIVSRKVVDDAISITVLIALFLIGGSIALGSVADKDVNGSFYLGLLGIALAGGKLFVMRCFAGIRVRALSAVGVIVLVACNYLGPVLMARSIAENPAQEMARRDLWLWIWYGLLFGAGVILAEAMRTRPPRSESDRDPIPFLRRPLMVYILALIVVLASGIHQYSMAFTFALERVVGDFVPLVVVATLFALEILRLSGNRYGLAEVLVACVPLAVMGVAIHDRSVLASGQFGPGLLCYPPVLLALTGLVLAGVAFLHKWYRLLPIAGVYMFGVILTAGFSPGEPHDLNVKVCLGILTVIVLVYGVVVRNQGACIAGVALVCVGLGSWEPLAAAVEPYGLTRAGALAGVFGLGSTILYFFFGRQTLNVIQIAGTLCLAGFAYDFLPASFHWRYIVVVIVTGLLTVGLWLRAREIPPIIVLWLPSLARLYMLARSIAYWRFVILGFLALAVGAVVSLLKRPDKVTGGQDDPQTQGETP